MRGRYRGERRKREVQGAGSALESWVWGGGIPSHRGCLGRVLCPFPELYFLIFGSQWAIFVEKFFVLRQKGGGANAQTSPPTGGSEKGAMPPSHNFWFKMGHFCSNAFCVQAKGGPTPSAP